MDTYQTYTVSIGRFVATHEPTRCDGCRRDLQDGACTALFDDSAGHGPVLLCRLCGAQTLEMLMSDLLDTAALDAG